jgi:uracil-DNA glycosylase
MHGSPTASTGVAAAIATIYARFAHSFGLVTADVRSHPSEAQIVAESTASHLDRLRSELETCRPDLVVTLGNAALRVMRRLVTEPPVLTYLAADDSYGRQLAVETGERSFMWIPLAHPAAPRRYQVAHERWQAAAR